jgi:hypothetical protein
MVGLASLYDQMNVVRPEVNIYLLGFKAYHSLSLRSLQGGNIDPVIQF